MRVIIMLVIIIVVLSNHFFLFSIEMESFARIQISVMKFTSVTLQLRPGKRFAQLDKPYNCRHN